MRASRRRRAQRPVRKAQKAKHTIQNSRVDEMHISGAEGLCALADIQKRVEEYISRAFTHPRGKPDAVVVTIEKLKQKPKRIKSLPVSTLECRTPSEAKKFIVRMLRSLGIAEKAIKKGIETVYAVTTMRGASLITAKAGKRVEPDTARGLRTSRLGISKEAHKTLSLRLEKQGINSTTVKEALILASKVAVCPQVIAELCVSDDPTYTTGYVASRQYGYVRIPHIKRKGYRRGGRVFFVTDDADIISATVFLEKKLVMVHRISSCQGILSEDEIFNRNNR